MLEDDDRDVSCGNRCFRGERIGEGKGLIAHTSFWRLRPGGGNGVHSAGMMSGGGPVERANIIITLAHTIRTLQSRVIPLMLMRAAAGPN